MRQRRATSFIQRIFLAALLGGLGGGCERAAAPAGTATSKVSPTVVSLVPAATDLILGMGAGEHVVAVSNWDAERPEISGLPRVGDYRNIDWERITQLRPAVMIVQYREDKMPPGLTQRAKSLGIHLVNVKINRLNDVFTSLQTLGEALGEPDRAKDAQADLRRQLDAVRQRVSRRPPVRTLISRSESPLAVVGGGNFMDDVLALAGGKNVIEGGDNSYPTIDRERLLMLDPDVVLHVLPGATPQQIESARAFWDSVPQLSAVKAGRVHLLTDSYLLLPGYSVGRIAEAFASKLHPDSKSKERL